MALTRTALTRTAPALPLAAPLNLKGPADDRARPGCPGRYRCPVTPAQPADRLGQHVHADLAQLAEAADESGGHLRPGADAGHVPAAVHVPLWRGDLRERAQLPAVRAAGHPRARGDLLHLGHRPGAH